MTVNRVVCKVSAALAVLSLGAPVAMAVPSRGKSEQESPLTLRLHLGATARFPGSRLFTPAEPASTVLVAQCGAAGAPGCGQQLPPAAVPPPAPGAPPAPVQYAPRRIYPRKGMMITGWVMLGASWLLATLIGSIQNDVCDLTENDRCKSLAKSMIIPVAGPFLAMYYSNSSSQQWGLGVLGASEVLGLVLGIVGTIQHVVDKRAAAAQRGVALGRGWRLDVGAVGSLRPGGVPTPTLVVGTRLR